MDQGATRIPPSADPEPNCVCGHAAMAHDHQGWCKQWVRNSEQEREVCRCSEYVPVRST